MPNGQTDIFRIPSELFLLILGNAAGDPIRLLEVGHGDWTECNSEKVIELVEKNPSEDIQVEEQHGSTYIAHLGANWEYWVEIIEGTVLFQEIRRVRAEQTR